MSNIQGQNSNSIPENAGLQNVEEYLLANGFELKERFDRSIKDIVDVTGTEFLSLGESLKNYYYTSKELANLSKEGAINYSEKVIGDIISNMQVLLAGVTKTLNTFDANVTLQNGYLKEISSLINKISNDLSGTKKIVKYLRMLAISTKIENSRLADGKNDFNILADNVEKLSVVIHDKSIHLQTTSTGLFNVIKDTLVKTESIKKEQAKQESNIIDDINKALLLLTEKYNVCFTKVNEINEISEKISRTTGEIVSSIQIQDIARQQLEHIADAVEDIERLSSSLPEKNDDKKIGRVTAINQISRVQLAQLENSGSELTEALNHIEDGLNILKEEIHSIYNSSLSLGLEDKNEESYINSIIKGLKAVDKELLVNSGLRNDFYESVKQITDTVAVLTKLIEDIEDVGNEIELISLNSRIKASQTGSEGAALDVLAESIQGLSNDAKNLTGKIRGLVDKINVSADELMKSNNMGQDKSQVSSDGLNDIMNKLLQFQSDSASLFASLSDKISSLNDEDNSAPVENVKNVLNSNFLRMSENLEEIITNTAPLCQEGIEMNEDMEMLKNKYTMDKERDIHNKLLNGEDISADNSDELGDNIELF
jgi:hypothetical protein